MRCTTLRIGIGLAGLMPTLVGTTCINDPTATSFVIEQSGHSIRQTQQAVRQSQSPGICAGWTKSASPVWEGYYMAADPCVVRDGDVYRLYHTGYLPEPARSVIAVAQSADGLTWSWAKPTDPENPVAVALDGRPNAWDAYVETSHVMRVGEQWWMFYTGYVPDPSRFVAPYEVGLAKSNDGLNWTRASDEPVLRLTESGPDNGAMTSPAVVQWGGAFYMVYLGWELDAAGQLIDFRIGGAVSHDTAGLVWERLETDVFDMPFEELPWASGAVEPTLMRASDGWFYLFITADSEVLPDSPSSIAVLRSCGPLGPWDACPKPIVQMTHPWESVEIIAPHVLEDEGLLRMWYHGLTLDDPLTGERFRIGYADTTFENIPGEDVGLAQFVLCMGGPQMPVAPSCGCVDSDSDGDVDIADAHTAMLNRGG